MKNPEKVFEKAVLVKSPQSLDQRVELLFQNEKRRKARILYFLAPVAAMLVLVIRLLSLLPDAPEPAKQVSQETVFTGELTPNVEIATSEALSDFLSSGKPQSSSFFTVYRENIKIRQR